MDPEGEPASTPGEPTAQPVTLSRRLELFDGYRDDPFGRFDARDFIGSALLFLLLPLLLVWWLK